MERRTQVLDAAITVLGTEGLRQLTHRRVDRQAGLPEGSSSNLFRTRSALLNALAQRFAERDRERWSQAPESANLETLVAAIAQYCGEATSTDQVMSRARYTLFLAAQTEPELGTALAQARSGLEDWGAAALAEFGVQLDRRQVAEILDQVDGLILHQLCFPVADFDPSGAIRHLLRRS